jgi:hypothetical protein
MSKRKAATTNEQITSLEKLYDECEREMVNIKKAVAELQEAWNDTYDKLEVLYQLKAEMKGAKRQKLCPVVKRKDSFPDPPKSM